MRDHEKDSAPLSDLNEIRKHSQRLIRLGSRMGDRREDVEDAAQEAWVEVLSKHNAPLHNVFGWMRVAMIHALRRGRERNQARTAREVQVARTGSEPSTLEVLANRSQTEQLLDLIEGLEEPYREVMQLRFAHGLEPAEIAKQLGRPEGTVRSQLKRSIDRLRDRVHPRRELLGFSWISLFRRRIGRRSPAPAGALGATQTATLLIVAGGGIAAGLMLFDRSSSSDPTHPISAPSSQSADRRVFAQPDPAQPLERLPVHPESTAATSPTPGAFRSVVLNARALVANSEQLELGGIDCFGTSNPDGADARHLGSTDDRGSLQLSIDQLPLWIWLESDQFLSFRYWVDPSAAGEATPLVVDMYATSQAEVRVSSLGSPVANAEVEVIRSLHRERSNEDGRVLLPLPARRRTDINGTTAIPRVPGPSRTWIGVRAPEFAPAFVPIDVDQDTISVGLAPPSSLTFDLIGPDGSFAVGARATLDLAFPAPRLEQVADHLGRLYWPTLGVGEFLLRVELNGHSSVLAGELRKDETVRTVHLDGSGSIRGKLVGFPNSSPWVVSLIATGKQETDAMLPFPHLLEPSWRSTSVSADGTFWFGNCRRSSYEVVTHAPGSNVRIAAAEVSRPDTGEVVLRPTGPIADVAFVTGSLQGPEPNPGKLLLRPHPPLAPMEIALTQEGREFSSASLLPGSYDLILSTAGRLRWLSSLELVAGNQEIRDIQANPTGAIELNCVDAKVYTVSLSSADFTGTWHLGKRSKPWTQRLHGANLPSVPAGEFALLARSIGMEDVTTTVEIEAGQTSAIEIAPRSGREIQLFVSSVRPLLPEETLTMTASDGVTTRPVHLLNGRVSRNRPGAILIQRASVYRGTQEIHVASSAGLRGQVRFEPDIESSANSSDRLDVELELR